MIRVIPIYGVIVWWTTFVLSIACRSNLCDGYAFQKKRAFPRQNVPQLTPVKPNVMKRFSAATLKDRHRSPMILFEQKDPYSDSFLDDTNHDFGPVKLLTTECMSEIKGDSSIVVEENKSDWLSPSVGTVVMATSVAAVAVFLGTVGDIVPSSYAADSISEVAEKFQGLSQGNLNPANFQPVCPTSDGFYRILQSSTIAIIGKESFIEYGPLIAGGLLRVRLELCVVESFFNEAVGPFIAENGLSWVLPIRETVETFIAGGIFAIATTFILIGSTKLLTVIAAYTDFIFGVPSRLLGGYTFDRAQGKPVTLDIGIGPLKTRLIGPPDSKPGEDPKVEFNLAQTNIFTILILIISGAVKAAGELLGLLRFVVEQVDFFVGRYLVLWASFYVLIKFLHFKVFPDFP